MRCVRTLHRAHRFDLPSAKTLRRLTDEALKASEKLYA